MLLSKWARSLALLKIYNKQKGISMKKSLAVAASVVFLVSSPVSAETPAVKQIITDKASTLITPQQKIKRLPRSAAPLQTGQSAGTQSSNNQNTDANNGTPQGAANIQIGDITFSPQSASGPSCEKKWVVDLINTGDADSGANLVMTPTYRTSPGVNEQTLTDIDLQTISAKRTVGYTGYMPMREHEEAELLLKVREGNTDLASKVFTLPQAVRPSGQNVALGDGIVSSSEISFVVQNRSNVDVNAMTYMVRGFVNAGDTASEHIVAGTVSCLPAGGSRTINASIPSAPYHSYLVRLAPSGTAQVLVERTYAR